MEKTVRGCAERFDRKKSPRPFMIKKVGLVALLAVFSSSIFAPPAHAQQTLGGITGSVSDKTGGVLPDTDVTIVADQTKLTRSLKPTPTAAMTSSICPSAAIR
jgi:hypothetical protein